MAREIRRTIPVASAKEADTGVDVFSPDDAVSGLAHQRMNDAASLDAHAFDPVEASSDAEASPASVDSAGEAVVSAAVDVVDASAVQDSPATDQDRVDYGYGDEVVHVPGEGSGAQRDRGGETPLLGGVIGGVVRWGGRKVNRLITLESERSGLPDDAAPAAVSAVTAEPIAEGTDDITFAASGDDTQAVEVHSGTLGPIAEGNNSTTAVSAAPIETGDSLLAERTSEPLAEHVVTPQVPVAIPTVPGLEIVQGRQTVARDRHVGVGGQGLSAFDGKRPDLSTRDETIEHPVVGPRVPGEPLMGEGARTSSEPATTNADMAVSPAQRIVEDDSASHSDTVPTLTRRQRRQLDREASQAEATATANEQLAQFLTQDEKRIGEAIASGADRRHLAGGEPFAMLGTKTIGELHRIARCAILADQEVRTGVVWDAFTDPNLRDTELDQVRALVHRAYDRRSPNPVESVNMATELNPARREGVMQGVELAVDSATEAAERSVLPGIYVGLEKHLLPAIEARRGKDSTKPVLSPAEALKRHAEEASLEIIKGAHINIRMEGDEDDGKAEAYIVAGSREVVVRNGYFVDPTGQFRRDPEVIGIDKLVNYMGGYGAWFNNTPSGKNLQAEVLHQPPNTEGGFVAVQSFRSASFAMMSPTTDQLPSGRDPEAMGLAVPSAQGVDTTMKGYVEVTLDARHIYQGPYNQLLEMRNGELKEQPIALAPVLPQLAGETLLEQARVVSERLEGIQVDREAAVARAMEVLNQNLASSVHIQSLARQMGLVGQDEKPAIGRGSLKDVPGMDIADGEIIDVNALTTVSLAMRPDATIAELASGSNGTLDMGTLLAVQDASDQHGQAISLS